MDTLNRHRSRAIALGVAAIVALIALAPGAWGTAVAQTAGTVTVTFTVDGTTTTVATTPDNLATITIPPGARITGLEVFVAEDTESFETVSVTFGVLNALARLLGTDGLSSQWGSSGRVQSADGTRLFRSAVVLNFTVPTGSLLGGRDALVMDAGALSQRGMQAFQVGAPADLGVVATMTINVSAEALADVGGDLSRIEVFYLNEFTGLPEPLTMLPSPGPGMVEFEWTKEGTYILVTNLLVPLPPLDLAPAAQAVPSPADTGMGASASSGVTDPMAIALGLLALVGIGGLGARFAVRRARA